VKYEEKEEEM